MALKPDTKYEATVRQGSGLIESATGTPGYQVMLSCSDGATSFVIWLTSKNRTRALRYFEALGVQPANLKKKGYFDLQLGLDIQGKEIMFGTREDEYQGKKSVKVAWIGKKSDPDLARAAANFFSREPEADTTSKPVPDDEIPF